MRRFVNAWTIIGAGLLVLGTGPLSLIIFLAEIGVWPDPNPNPIGPGLLAFLTFWPSIIILTVGITKGLKRQPPRPHTAPAPHSSPAHKPELTAEQQAYISSGSFAGGLGIFYFMYMHVTGAFFRHFWSNLYWPRMVAHARQWVWEAGDWQDFETFKSRSDDVDLTAKILLAVFIPAVVLLMFL